MTLYRTVLYCTEPYGTLPYRTGMHTNTYSAQGLYIYDASVSYRIQYQYVVCVRIMAKRHPTVRYRTIHYRTVRYHVLGGDACWLGIFAGTIYVTAAPEHRQFWQRKSSCPRHRRDYSQILVIFLSWMFLGRLHALFSVCSCFSYVDVDGIRAFCSFLSWQSSVLAGFQCRTRPHCCFR